jgi:hypothetical protein
MIATPAMALLAASLCQPDDIRPLIDPNLLFQIARHESGLRVDAVNHNANGTSDYGATQVNETNFVYLGVTADELTDTAEIIVRGVSVPRGLCAAMRASARFLANLSRYNTGKPSSSVGIKYATGVINEPLTGVSQKNAHAPIRSIADRGNEMSDIEDAPGQLETPQAGE